MSAFPRIKSPDKASRRLPTVPTGHTASHSSKVRRLKTTSELPEEEDFPASIDVLQARIFAKVVERLQVQNVITHGLLMDQLMFMLPQGHPELWHDLIYFPLLVSDAELGTILELETSTVVTPNPPPGTTMYYVRSFRLTVRQVLAIVAKWDAKDQFFEESEAWKAATEWISDPEEEVFIRYVGMSTVLSAYARFASDLEMRTGGVFGAFLAELVASYPEVIDSASVYSFPCASTKALQDKKGRLYPLDITHTDIREQALIALLGQTTLLNRQVGGKHTSYQPSPQDANAFLSLNTKAFIRLEQITSTEAYQEPSFDMQQAVAGWCHDVCELGMKYPKELGTDTVPHSEAMEIAWA